MCIDVCIDMCVDVCVDVCIDVCIDMQIDVYGFIGTNMCACMGICKYTLTCV